MKSEKEIIIMNRITTGSLTITSKRGAQRSHNVRMFNRLIDAREFCKTTGSGYITAQDKKQRVKFIEFFGGFKPSAAEQDLVNKIVTVK